MKVIWEYDGPEWRQLKAVREALGTLGPRGKAFKEAIHAIQEGRLEASEGYLAAALLDDEGAIDAAVDETTERIGLAELQQESRIEEGP